jgi:aminoglycoside 6-adenylyltransferase
VNGLEELQRKALAWAESRADIRVVLLIGSRARRDQRADELSDLDLVLFTTDIQAYQTAPDWLDDFGKLWVSVKEPRSDGCPEYLAVYEGGSKLDFNFFPMSMLEEFLQPGQMHSAFRRGFQILVDKDGQAAQMPPSPFAPPQPAKPTLEAFGEVVNTFWYDAYQVAKFIRRGELWVAHVRDGMLKQKLLTVIEWHAQAQHGWDYDTWHGGRFMAEWASAPVYAALRKTFARFDHDDGFVSPVGKGNRGHAGIYLSSNARRTDDRVDGDISRAS